LFDDELDAEVVEVEAASRRLDARRLELVAEAERRCFYETLGYLSATAWLADRLDKTRRAARGLVGLARSLQTMPLVRRALAEGVIDQTRAVRLAEAQRFNPDAFTEAEGYLVEAAETVPAGKFRHVVEYWKQAADPTRWESDQQQLVARRFLHVSPTIGGMVRLDGELDPEAGHIVLTALRAHTNPVMRNRADARTPAQIRADALVDICRYTLDHGDLPLSGGERPHITVLVDLAVLEGRVGKAELPDTGPITANTARRVACDASICRIITQGPSEILDIGRRTRVVPPAIRRALELRDGGCTAPGCDRPPAWCDAHHLIAWALGGPTALWNLALLCRRHHRMVHDGELILPRTE
jgi:hypothetical protein